MLLSLFMLFFGFLPLWVIAFCIAFIAARVYMRRSKKKRILIAVCIVVFLMPVLAAIPVGAMFMRPYVEYGDMLSALEVCDSRIEDVKLYFDPDHGPALTANEHYYDAYDHEQLEIIIFLGSKDVRQETAAEIGNAAKDVVDTYIREHQNDSSGLEKRIYMVLYPVLMSDGDIDHHWDFGSRVYYRIWDFEKESFEWMLDGNLWVFAPEGHPTMGDSYWINYAVGLFQSYF
ncbi:MAG: hypothetical protein LBL49_06290 [Clostridiales Family XIII bacterium]|jgi:hypothetical protein|nr:hypothetical protein [Clostridiales Family XIII bacterium]